MLNFNKKQASQAAVPQQLILKSIQFDTKLGPMIAIADEENLYILEFIDRLGLEAELKRLRKKLNAAIVPGETPITKSIEAEITNYFNGENAVFKTPFRLVGSDFQIHVWNELRKIPPAETRSYLDVAKAINAPTSFRAVARANSLNQLAILVPCHRVINANGNLGGYAAGIARKQWLLAHEKKLK